MKTVDYKDIGLCPICGGSDHEVSRETDGYGSYWYECTCCECEAFWRQDFHYIEVPEGYSEVTDGDGNEIAVTVTNAPVLDADEIVSKLIPLCGACDSKLCCFNPDGICRFPLVFSREPKHEFNGCEGCEIGNK